ncbi:MAG TPA: OmpA family protein [Brevundimonas sp.]|nr:OmpA family protein [Brevundimonas sp.]
MRIILALAAAAVLAGPVAAAPQAAPAIVHFELDSDALDAPGRARLDQTTDEYRRGGLSQVVLAGHAGRDEGSPEYTVGLSQRRANTVRDYLVANGVPAGAITTQAFGQTRPAVDDGPDAANRRVEVTFGPGSGW